MCQSLHVRQILFTSFVVSLTVHCDSIHSSVTFTTVFWHFSVHTGWTYSTHSVYTRDERIALRMHSVYTRDERIALRMHSVYTRDERCEWNVHRCLSIRHPPLIDNRIHQNRRLILWTSCSMDRQRCSSLGMKSAEFTTLDCCGCCYQQSTAIAINLSDVPVPSRWGWLPASSDAWNIAL